MYFHAAGMSCSNSMCSLLLMFINQKIDSRSTCRNKLASFLLEETGRDRDQCLRICKYGWSFGSNYNYFVGSDTVLCKKKLL